MKIAKKRTPTFWRKKCVTLAKEEAKRLAGYKCEYCGRSKGDVQLHGSHILPEGVYISLSDDVSNIISLCAIHHIAGMSRWIGRSKEPSFHGDPIFFARWIEEKWPGRYDALRKKAQELKVIDWEKRFKELNNAFTRQM